MTTPTELVHRVDCGGVASITLDSPHNRNALSSQLVAELFTHLTDADGDPAVRAVTVGATGTTFCAGADLKERTSTTAASNPASAVVSIFKAFANLTKPVIGVVGGHVRAGGMGIVASCDVVVASDRATFAIPEVHRGLVPAMILVPLTKVVHARELRRYSLTGETFDADEAARIGLVNIAVDHSELDAAAERVAGWLRLGSPDALAQTKALLDELKTLHGHEAFERTAALSAARFASDDAREGMLAFLEKRAPYWASGVATVEQ